MQTLIKFLVIFMALLIYNNLSAQPGHGLLKQPPRINGAVRAAANASINARIHANSNSVFGTGNTHPNYARKEEPKKEEIKEEGEINKSKGKKSKK